MRVAPCEMHFSRVPPARSVTSSTVKVCLTAETRSIARCGKRFFSCSQRPRMQDLSRWIWVSTKPEQTSRLPACICSRALPPSFEAMAAIRPSFTPMSTAGWSGLLSGSRTSRTTRSKSITSLFAVLRHACCNMRSAFHSLGQLMLSRRRFSVLATLAAPGIALAQAAWPSKPIRWIVNFPPAGAADILSRTLAEYFGNRLGQPIVVENKPGAGGLLGADIVAKAKGDAYVVMMSSAASHGIGPVLYKDVPYDPLADFTHIHLVGTFPSVLAVNGGSGISTVQQLVELAKSKPGEVTYGSG